MNAHVVTDEEIARFNSVREITKGREFKRSEIIQTLNEELGWPKSSPYLLMALCEGINPPIVKVRKGVYIFNKEPVYKARLGHAFKRYTQYTNPERYANSTDTKINIEEAIKVLKDAGYKVLAPVVEFKEV